MIVILGKSMHLLSSMTYMQPSSPTIGVNQSIVLGTQSFHLVPRPVPLQYSASTLTE